MPTTADFRLAQLRKKLGLSQSEMARRMGLSLRPYQQLELELRDARSRHIRLAESVALDVAVEKDELEMAPLTIRRKAIKLAIMVLRETVRQK
jgi:transcriptional regulator with XRE-family HTH domain